MSHYHSVLRYGLKILNNLELDEEIEFKKTSAATNKE